VRALGQPQVLKSAAVASVLTAAACYPRLALGEGVTHPIWYMEALLVLGSTVLWGFVFAWHTKYTGRPVFNLEPGWSAFGLATFSALVLAAIWYVAIDPSFRRNSPEDYPLTVDQWAAKALFTLAFANLFLVFAPYAWLIRLFRKHAPALLMTVLFGLVVLGMRNRSAPIPLSPLLFVALLALRVTEGFLLVFLFLRGGVLLVWWCSLLLHCRLLLWLASR
jgi:hypothetical protein